GGGLVVGGFLCGLLFLFGLWCFLLWWLLWCLVGLCCFFLLWGVVGCWWGVWGVVVGVLVGVVG
ncbi:hypothetical protein ACTHTR_10730, partial [Neisseria sp. P0018.S004]|uniref:hypothetical protein n=1 Tax=Neisseria sp. P0018.S004 TaxID=3436790 RepID=UPI003F80E29D